jgi:hypothetical protein
MTNDSEEQLTQALLVIQSLLSKCEKVIVKFPHGTSQNTLLKNRINALPKQWNLVKAP